MVLSILFWFWRGVAFCRVRRRVRELVLFKLLGRVFVVFVRREFMVIRSLGRL